MDIVFWFLLHTYLQETGGKLHELEANLKAKEKVEVKLSTGLKHLKETLKTEGNKGKQLEKSLADVRIDGKFVGLKDNLNSNVNP